VTDCQAPNETDVRDDPVQLIIPIVVERATCGMLFPHDCRVHLRISHAGLFRVGGERPLEARHIPANSVEHRLRSRMRAARELV
jgi:hypothetical protein